ncbi:hypothetical protein LPC08_12665 [Roseomonas sp. OT10]|uniref:hypothetical protein n=1 Tax=Roseomonas cutis TaxID=2897332 RepID=UPI001E5DD220|nr:hypothetical protein [Roseomonas sp. OT10]UFN46882.1 hypothetical protein LPC08_12665 [Roseomonas sp. OT10]
MSDLIARIGNLRGGIDISADLGAVAGQLGDLGAVVQALKDGPPALGDLTAAIGTLPVPPALGGLATLATTLPQAIAQAPQNPAALVEPLLAPLRALAQGGFSVSVSIDITAVMQVVQEVIRLVTGTLPGGPQGLSGSAGSGPTAFAMPDTIPLDQVRAAIAEARGSMGALGPSLDAAALLALLRRAGAGLGGRHPRLPPIPVLGDLLEALGTLAAWQAAPPAALAQGLAATLQDAARLIDMPRRLSFAPLQDAAAKAAGAGEALTLAGDTLAAVLPPLSARLATGLSLPSASEATALERAAEAAESVLGALHPVDSPLARIGELPFEATGHLLRALRALSGAGDGGAVLGKASEVVAAIPAPPAAPLGAAVEAVAGLDLSAIAGPIGALRDAVGEALDAVAAARGAVRDALSAALTPVADALDTVLDAAHLEEAVPALTGFATDLSDAMDTQVRPVVGAVRGAVEGAVQAVADATVTFDPERLVAPLRDALNQLAALLEDPALQDAFAAVAEALRAAVAALQGLNLSAAADETIRNIEQIEQKLAAIDPSMIPDAAKPGIEQAVKVVTEIDFTGTVGTPLIDGIVVALREGPGALLGGIEGGLDRLRTELDAFKPSAAIGAEIGEPFAALSATLQGFTPSALLGQVQAALNEVAARVGVLDPGAVLDPLREGHATLTQALAGLSPDALLRPVREEADRAVTQLMEQTHLDDAFAGLAELVAAVEGPLGILADLRDLLRDAAALLASPGDAEAAIAALLDEAVVALDPVDMAALTEGFAATAAAVAGIQRGALVAPLGPVLRQAATAAPAALAGPGARLARLIATLPQEGLVLARDAPATRRARDAAARLSRAGEALAAAMAAWPALGQRIGVQAPALEAQLADYQRLLTVEGGAFAGLDGPAPPDLPALKAAVRAALEEEAVAPLRLLQAGFHALAPWAAALAQGVSDLLDAIRAKLDAILGEGGLGGAATALIGLRDQLTDLDLEEVAAPLRALHTRLTTALAALDPAPVEAALDGAVASVTGLLDVEALLPSATLRNADAAWNAAVARIAALSPERVVADVLDPAWERALGAIAPALELPLQLRALIDAASGDLPEQAKIQLARVEEAFDAMLRAIPLRTGIQSASVSVSVSVAA